MATPVHHPGELGVVVQRHSPAFGRRYKFPIKARVIGATDRLHQVQEKKRRDSSATSVPSQPVDRSLLGWVISIAPMCDEFCQQDIESLPLPKEWQSFIRNAVLNVIGIVRIAMLAGREALIKNGHAKDARIHQLESEVAMLREELRINGRRMQRVPPHRRPQFTSR